jgi:aryl-phospho-beta-D-glucosidase BglC (GH1 family)
MRQWQGYRNGINLGGWLSQFENYSKKHFDTFIQEKDFKKIAEMGFDHVRIPIDYTLLETEEGEPKEDGFFYLDKALKWCSKYGLRMLIDVHEVYGYTFDPLKRDVDRMRFFYNPGQQRRFRGLWLRIAHRYGSSFGTVAFELLNEVVLEEVAEAWNDVVRDVITAIRPLAPRTWIVVGGVRYNSVKAVELLEAPFDEHIVYNFHCYEPFAFTHQKAYWIDRMPEDFEMTPKGSIKRYLYQRNRPS